MLMVALSENIPKPSPSLASTTKWNCRGLSTSDVAGNKIPDTGSKENTSVKEK